jgi:acyl dehydratase
MTASTTSVSAHHCLDQETVLKSGSAGPGNVFLALAARGMLNAMSTIKPMFLEDLSVGQTYRTETVSVDPHRVKEFASEFDPQPFHLDETAAAKSLFGRLVASGWHTAALTMRLMVTGGFRIAGGMIGVGVEQIRWPRPVYPGDVLYVEGEVLEVRPSRSNPKQGIVRFRSKTINQGGEVVMEQVASLVVPRDPARAAESTEP